MKKVIVSILCLLLISLGVFADGKKAKVEIKDIPKAVLDAAKAKVKGFEAKEATVEDEKGGKEYEIKGTADGKNIEVEVVIDKDGKITKVEIEEKKEGQAEGDGDGD